MTTVNFSRRISAKTISADINAYHGLSTIIGYASKRVEATPFKALFLCAIAISVSFCQIHTLPSVSAS